MPWAVAAAAVAAGGSIYAANKNSSAAKDAAQSTKPSPYSGTTPAGYSGFDPSTGTFTAAPAPNPFQNLFSNIGLSSLANSGVASSMPFNGANPELMQQLFNADQSSQPGNPEFQAVLDKMRGVAAPQEQRDRVALDTQQFNTGTFGTTGGADRLRALYEAQGQNDLQRQLSAQGITTQNAQQRFQNALTTVNQGMSSQQQQFNIGSAANSANQNSFQQLLQQLGLGVSAGGGVAPNAAIFAGQQAGNVPLAFSQLANSPAFAAGMQKMFGSNTGAAGTPVSPGGQQSITDSSSQPFNWGGGGGYTDMSNGYPM